MSTETKQEKRSQYVAVLECCEGNGQVGEMWCETHICDSSTTIQELVDWKLKHRSRGRLTITEAT